jgi:hypothetical protein
MQNMFIIATIVLPFVLLCEASHKNRRICGDVTGT